MRFKRSGLLREASGEDRSFNFANCKELVFSCLQNCLRNTVRALGVYSLSHRGKHFQVLKVEGFFFFLIDRTLVSGVQHNGSLFAYIVKSQ